MSAISTFLGLDGPLHDLRCATVLLETMHECAMAPSTVLPSFGEGYMTYSLSDEQRDGLSYAITLVGDQARDLGERFQEALTSVRASEANPDRPPKRDLLEIEDPLRTALGLAKALRAMAENPVGDLDAQPVYILGRDIEAALEVIERRWKALVE